MQEDNLLQMIIKQQSWEDLIYNIVTIENLDPWDVDLVKLTNSFLEYTRGMRILDFRIPAKVILVAAILLKLKSEILHPTTKVKPIEYSFIDFGEPDEFEMIRQKISELKLEPGIRREIKRKVTLDELVNALRKAMKVEKKRETRKRRLGRRLRREIDLGEEDIEERISELMKSIDLLLLTIRSEKVEFSKIVEVWQRDEIVKHFLPLLHLSMRDRVDTEQEDFFKEIWIQKK